MTMLHTTLAEGRWFTFSLAEQFANIGSEIHRLIAAERKRDYARFYAAFDRALELIDLGLNEYDTSFQELDDYFFKFALVVQGNK